MRLSRLDVTSCAGAILVVTLGACGKQTATPSDKPPAAVAAPAEARDPKKAHVFHGTVEKNDPATKSLTIAAEDVEGWMAAMTMVMTVDKPEILPTIKVGDRLTATVYEGNFQTLYDVKVTSPAGK